MKRLIVLFILMCTPVFAQDKVTIEADNVETPKESVFHAKGNVKIFQGNKTMLADEIFYFKDQNKIHAINNVRLTEDDTFIDCDEMLYDTEKQSGEFTNAKAFMPPYHFINASQIDRLNTYTYQMKDAVYTTCNGKVPDWSFKSSSANLILGGYLSAWHTTGRVKEVPVVYTPYFLYPVKTERETGFLVPDFGFSGNMGPFIQPKFFWNIDVDQDATFTALLPSGKTPLYGVEHRYLPNTSSSMYSYVEYTKEEKLHPDNNSSGDYTIDEKPGRYFVYNNTNLQITENLSILAQIDNVSDYEYLDDYLKFSMLDDYENSTDVFHTKLMLNYGMKYADFSLNYLDTMEYNVGGSYVKEHTYSAPQLTLRKTITKFPVYFTYLAQHDNVRYTRYIYNYSSEAKNAAEYRYDRDHLKVKFYKPFDLYIATFTPSLSLMQTRWYNLSDNLNIPADHDVSSFASVNAGDDSYSRRIYSQRHTLKFNEIYKEYSPFRHSIYNTIEYLQTPYVNHKYIPDNIADDLIDVEREYIYTLNNYFLAEKWSVSLKNSLRHNLRDEDKTSDGRDYYLTDLTINTNPVAFHIKHEYNKDKRTDDFLSSSIRLKFNPFYIRAAYSFDKDEYNGEDNNTSAELAFVYSTNRYDLSYTRSISGMNTAATTANLDERADTLEFTYKKDCWSFGISYIRETDPANVDMKDGNEVEHTILFHIALKGLSNPKTGFRNTNTTYFDEDDTDDEI